MSNYSSEEYNLEAWWNEYGEQWCEPSLFPNLGDVDYKGKPYDWDNGHKTQIPAYKDYLLTMAYFMVETVNDGNNHCDMTAEDKRSWNSSEVNNLWKLHDELYSIELEWGSLNNSGNVSISIVPRYK
tara:strand:- start:8801 stop:9181 length:381 start_codon:yes stop_codon:yes gene_type:complete